MINNLASPRVTQRDDVVLRNGKLTLFNEHLTPQDAMLEDLGFVRTVLDEAGIDFLLVRGKGNRPVIAVNAKDRKAIQRALTAACDNEPFYAKTPGLTTVLVADGKLSDSPRASAVVLYRPRIEPQGLLRYGAAFGIRIELWKYTDTHILAPEPNALMRHKTPRAELVRDDVEVYGQSWPSIAGMFDELADDISFDIDIVFSWVDGAAVEWQRIRARRMESYVIGEGDGSEARFRQLDELKYALRSVNLFAPWIRNIYIVTDSDRPAWLAEHPRVTVLSSEQFFTNQEDLPTHNSHAVESQLHNIPGISEHFLYSNDDMFFGRPVAPGMFYSSGGVSKFIEAETRIGTGESNIARSGFENAARVNRRLLKERFGKLITRHLEHAATPLRKSILQELEREFPEDFARTSASAFRQATDVSVTNSLYHYYALMSGRAVIQTDARVKYVDTTATKGLKHMRRLLQRRSHDFFCLNDGSFPELSVEERASAVKSFLQEYFPIAAPWEKTPEATLEAELEQQALEQAR
ncbi:MAG: sugar phosphotransferase [Homoserinimonas sp.]|nr:sugar phosphotransferase [Homoserinimonas sp.]